MTAETHPQAALFRALADHLDRFPHLATLNIGGLGLYATGASEGVKAAKRVLEWAKTLDEVESLTINLVPSDPTAWTELRLTGLMGGVQVAVWADDRNDLHRWIDQTKALTPLELDRLAAYVAAGTVDGVDS